MLWDQLWDLYLVLSTPPKPYTFTARAVCGHLSHLASPKSEKVSSAGFFYMRLHLFLVLQLAVPPETLNKVKTKDTVTSALVYKVFVHVQLSMQLINPADRLACSCLH